MSEPTTPVKPRLSALQWIIITATVLLGSTVSCEIDGSPFGVAEIIGGAIAPFFIGVTIAVAVKRWLGTVIAVLVIAMFFIFAGSAVVHDRKEKNISSPAGR